MIGGDAGGMAAASQIRRRRPDARGGGARAGALDQLLGVRHPLRRGRRGEGRRRTAGRPDPRASTAKRASTSAWATRRPPSTSTLREVDVRDPDDGTYRLGLRPPAHRHRWIADQAGAARHRSPVRARRPDAWTTPSTCCDARGAAAGASDVVVVGSGYIGLEMAEAFVRPGCSVDGGRAGGPAHGHARPRHGAARGGGHRRRRA